MSVRSINWSDLGRRLTRRGWPALVTAALAIVALALTLYAGGLWLSRNLDRVEIDRNLVAAVGPSDDASADSDDPPERMQRSATAVKRRNIFSPPAPEGFQGRLSGIIGNQALFNDRELVAKGEQIAGATVLEIGPDSVRIEFEGNARTLPVYEGGRARRGGGGNRGRNRGGNDNDDDDGSDQGNEGGGENEGGGNDDSSGNDTGGGQGGTGVWDLFDANELSTEQQDRLEAWYDRLTPDQRERVRQWREQGGGYPGG